MSNRNEAIINYTQNVGTKKELVKVREDGKRITITFCFYVE